MSSLEAGAADLLDVDLVGEPQDSSFSAVDLARAADREAGAGERMAATKASAGPSSRPSAAHLVLEQFRSGSTSFMFMRSGRPARHCGAT
jgi:hypothetical protein